MSCFPTEHAVMIEFVGGPLDGAVRLFDAHHLKMEYLVPRLLSLAALHDFDTAPPDTPVKYVVGVYRLWHWFGERVYWWAGERE
jgi:hypothetical protein